MGGLSENVLEVLFAFWVALLAGKERRAPSATAAIVIIGTLVFWIIGGFSGLVPAIVIPIVVVLWWRHVR